jgi:hypothetical protein
MNTLYSTTQDHLDIETVVSDLVVLKDGSACMVLAVSAINFGLLSEQEQEATIFAYAQLLNSLTFSIQIVVASRQKDISKYLSLLDERLGKISSPLIKAQMIKYREFVRSIVRQGNVLDKKFYVVIPFSSLELGAQSALATLVNSKPKLSKPVAEIVEQAGTSLAPKRDHLIRMFARIGLRARQLVSSELNQLFVNAYNYEHS